MHTSCIHGRYPGKQSNFPTLPKKPSLIAFPARDKKCLGGQSFMEEKHSKQGQGYYAELKCLPSPVVRVSRNLESSFSSWYRERL